MIRRMVAQDNDCTFVNSNTNAKRAYVARLRRLAPRTYAGVQSLARSWDADATLKNFLLEDLAMSPRYVATFEKNLKSVAQTLRANCRSGLLRLDLDPEAHFLGRTAAPTCE